jgi:amino acid adenylation domain-containing protein
MGTIKDNSTKIPDAQLRIRAKCRHPSGAFDKFKKEDIEQSIPDRFRQIVTQNPNRLAVKTQDQQLSYLELNIAANRLAHGILRLRKKESEPIVLLLEQGISPIIAILGVLKSGKFYVPLEPSYPISRTNYILRDSKAPLILTNDSNINLARELANGEVQLINIDELDDNLSSENPDLFISPDALAYIMYTSGSTGYPKGVIGIHRNILHEIMTLSNALHMCNKDKQTLIRSFSFNGSVRDIFGSLLNGASLHPLSIVDKGIDYLADWIIDERITIYRSVISTFRNFASTLTGEEHFPHLRVIEVGGETVNKKDVERFKACFSRNCIFITGLGITEIGTISRFFIDKSTELTGNLVPVGYPVEDMEINLFDDQGSKTGFNRIGEIVVKGYYLSPGYWNKPELTAARFRPVSDRSDEHFFLTGDLGQMLSDGCLLHLGRKDFQVKISGHRVEVVEIEAALLKLDTIEEAFVMARDDRLGNKYLIAYIVPATLPSPTVTSVRKKLAEVLPDYMIPSRFVMMDAIPLTPSGKVNRKALPEPENIRPVLDNPFVPPMTPIEQKLAEIWSEILDIRPIGKRDKFLELGGNSLQATRIISRIIHTFQVRLSMQSLLAAATIAEMAVLITQSQAEKMGQGELDRMLADIEKLSDKEAEKLKKLI